jgi:hypothetical protein
MIQKTVYFSNSPLCIIASFILVLFACFNLYGQREDGLSIETRAYLFHIVKKSPILEKNIGRAFEYSGPNVKLADGKLNYDSIEILIINEPSLLTIRTNLISISPKGLIAEAANKTAIWELCKQLKEVIEGKNKQELPLIDAYLDYFFDSIPKNIVRGKVYDELLNARTSAIFQTNLSLFDRLTLLEFIGIKDKNEQKKLLDAQNYAINRTIEERALRIFNILGGVASEFENLLFACGDGSYTSGLLEERDKDEYGEWNKGLPKAIGLFPYDLKLTGTKKQELSTKRITTKWLETVGNNKQTQLHFDIWGYNSSKQTTVVIERKNYQYHLFGSEKTRFLSPDSTFSKGTTFQKLINDLDNFTYKALKNSIEGKGGFNDQIKNVQKEINDLLISIKEEESNYSDMYKDNYVTKKRPSRKMRQLKKKNTNGGPINLKPTTKARRSAKSKKQTELVDYYERYDELTALESELIEERLPLVEEYTAKKRLLDYYKNEMGTNWMTYIEKDGLYTYSDGATFDLYTQEFTIPSEKDSEPFAIRLISIPEDFEGESSDEVMLHVSKIDALPYYEADFQLQLDDRFEPDKFNFTTTIFTKADSNLLKLLFEKFKKNTLPLNINLQANGIGNWNGETVIRDEKQEEITNYPGQTTEERAASRQTLAFKQLRYSSLSLKIDRAFTIRINSYTDPVASNLSLKELKLEEIAKTYTLSKNELLSAMRCLSLLQKIKEELAYQATNYLTQGYSKKFIDKLDDAIQKSKIQIGNSQLRLKEFRN